MAPLISRWIIKGFLSTLSFGFIPANERRLSILIFHRVRPFPDPLFPDEPDSAKFDQLMQIVAEHFNCLPLNQAIAMLSENHPLPRNAIAITFDDGYEDNYSEAMPILQRHGLTATFFVASGFLDGGCMWNDEAIELIRSFSGERLDLSTMGLGILASKTTQEKSMLINQLLPILKYKSPEERRDALDCIRSITKTTAPKDLMLTTDQVKDMDRAGMGIGGHTLTHPILARLEPRRARDEIFEDRERLASILGRSPELFAYPNGKPGSDYLPEHAKYVSQAGYLAAVSTAWGAVNRETDLFQIPRFSPWDRTPLRFALRLGQNYLRTGFDE